MDIIRSEEHRGGYMLASRPFELAEVKLLVDLVQSSKFITEKKSRELIGKLETLTSKYDAKAMQRQVEIVGRSKTQNETIYYNVDIIHTAIHKNVKIRFHYFDWDVNKKMQLRHDGAWYEVSPWKLTWDDENYYLIAWDGKTEDVRFYRVDKIVDITLTEQTRDGKEAFEGMNLADLSKKTFGMFAGKEKTVRLRAEDSLTGVIIDTFGTEVALRKDGEQHFIARADVEVSSQFFGFLAGLGNRVEIISPDEVRTEYKEYLANIISQYNV